MRTTLTAALLGFVALAAPLRAELTVFAGGRVRLPIMVAADAAPEERAAAEELARVLGAMSGFDWAVRTEAGSEAGIFVGRTRAAARALPALRPAADLLRPQADEIGPDGFRIRTLGERVFLEGATPEASAFAVSWLLQRHGGVRWYAPGSVGEVIPRRTEWTLPELSVAREPAYVSREISGVDAAWARRNGLGARIEYSHSLTHVFPPELGAAHPEWFPLVEGRRLLPSSEADYNWQPDLARPEVAEWGAQQALAAFAREPGRASFSLGMNDSVRFDQGAATQAAVAPLRYFRGMPDYSPLVFGFMNRAAEALARTRTNKYLGCLAYFWCEDTPSFPVHAQVIPYVTTDRTQFYDPAYRAADYALMSRWSRSGVRAFGIWEYGYGSAYVVPRVPHAMLAEAVREGWWRGARGYMADTNPHWGFDAYKMWMLSQLLWEPERTTAELEDDFFRGWYGPAAEPMRRFFARCEALWMAQPGAPWWIKYYRQQDQTLLFPPEVCRELRGMLTEAAHLCQVTSDKYQGTGGEIPKVQEAKSQSSEHAAGSGALVIENRQSQIENRVALTSRAFAVTEAAVEFAGLRNALAADEGTMTTEELAGQLVQLQRVRAALERAAQVAARSESAEDRAGATRPESAEDRAGATRPESAEDRAGAASTDEGGRTEDGANISRLMRHQAGEAGCVPLLRSSQRRTHWNAAKYAAEGTPPAMATGDVAFLLRNDPVPRLLAALGRRNTTAPLAVLTALRGAGEVPMDSAVAVPAPWLDLAKACADGSLEKLKNQIENGDFARVAPGRMEPAFLYPRWGELPAGWTVRGIATEAGRVALGEVGSVPVSGVPTGTPRRTQPAGRVLRFEGAWETQMSTTVAVAPGTLQVLSARMRGRSSPGGDAALFLVFATADGRITGEYRTQTLPKGESGWRTQLLAATAPADAAWVSVGVTALRQPAGDWLEAAEVELLGEGRR